MKTFYDKYKGGQYSQNGEANIIDECLRRIGMSKGLAIEFGAPTQEYCSNIFHLKSKGWRTIYYDLNPTDIEVIKATITPENVNILVLRSVNVLSIDCDGNDYNIWKPFTGKPEIIIIEINSSIPATEDKPVSDLQRGTAYKPMVELGINKGYFLLCHTGNLVFIRNDHRHLFPEIAGDGLSNWEEYFQAKWLDNV